MAVRGPRFGITEMPPGEAVTNYPDMDTEKLLGHIETQGVRFAWFRAAHCPCTPINTQTDQPDPNCEICRGQGTIYFGPSTYRETAEIGDLTPIQDQIIRETAEGTPTAVIRGVVAYSSQTNEFFNLIGRFMTGQTFLTVRPENRLAYFDRLVCLDAEICYDEIITTPITAFRYRPISINYVRSLTTRYREGADYTFANGVLTWVTGREPDDGTVLTADFGAFGDLSFIPSAADGDTCNLQEELKNLSIS